ncbi:MAG: hypothetical protein KC486_07250 [Myxococcales bacterium]|nr:hypothetical protein [Myxococcales bacterium]
MAASVVAAPPPTRRRHVPTVDEVCAQIMALAGIEDPQENPENWAICLEEVRDMKAACTEESWGRVGSCVLFAADVGALAACDRQELCVLREDAPPPKPMPVPPPPKRDPADANGADAAGACEVMVDLVLREDGKDPKKVPASKREAAVDACLDRFATPEFLGYPPATRRRIFACIRVAKSMKDAGLCAVPPAQ